MRGAPEVRSPATVITYSILKGPYIVQSARSILSPGNCARMHAFAVIAAVQRLYGARNGGE
jgi:hypothetical protein